MQGNVIRIYPEIRLEKTEIKAKPLNWVQHLVQNYKRKQDELRQKKIDIITAEAYKYYLVLVLDEIIAKNEVDFHPDLYRTGKIINTKAQSLALDAVRENVLQYGAKRIDECFSALRKQFNKKLKRKRGRYC